MNPRGPTTDIFRSEADQSANSFSNPLNVSHLYPGWGINPNYQTPAYDSPYRPAYSGPNPYGAYGNPGFFGGLNQLYNPLHNSPYWGNPVDNNRGALEAVSHNPMDMAMNIGQNWISPIASFMLANKFLPKVGSSIGRGLFGGLGTGLGLGSAGSGIMGAVGGFVGGMALPLAGGLALSHGIDSLIYQPYMRQRQMGRDLRDNFAGITFGDTGGNVISGRGLSFMESARMSSNLDLAGVKDMTFNANQYSGIASMGMRAGLFDDVSSKGIVSRVSSIADQIKLIVAISKDPNIQNAIEELSKLRAGGASLIGGGGSQAMSAYGTIGMHASAAGVSVQRLMNTVGAQGQYLYQMNGLTPYLGQIAAASAFSGFESSRRLGIISTAQLARMGGSEGATQSYLSGQIAGAMTPYNQMVLANQFLGGTNVGGISANLSAFGTMAGRDPLRTAGAMALYKNQMISSQLANDPRAAERQAIEYLDSIHRRPGARGQYSPEEVAAVMQNIFGYTPDQMQAYASRRAGDMDPTKVAQNIKSAGAQREELLRQALSQNMLYGGGLVSYARPVVKAIKEVQAGGSAGMGGLNKYLGFTGDFWLGLWDRMIHGGTLDKPEQVSDELAYAKTQGGAGSAYDSLSLLGQAMSVYGGSESIDDALGSGKYGALSSALSGLSGKAREKRIKELVNRALKSGLWQGAGITSRLRMTPEQVAANPAQFSSDPSVLKALRDAGGDIGKVKAIMAGEISRRGGGSLRGSSVNIAEDFSRDEARSILNILNSSSSKVSEEVEASTGGVDWTLFNVSTNRIDGASKLMYEAAIIQKRLAQQEDDKSKDTRKEGR